MAREIVKASNNFGKKELINSRSGYALQECEDKSVLAVTKAAIVMGPDPETGEEKEVAVLITADGECYTSISKTVREATDEVIDWLDDEELLESDGSVHIRLLKRKSKGGREFLMLNIV